MLADVPASHDSIACASMAPGRENGLRQKRLRLSDIAHQPPSTTSDARRTGNSRRQAEYKSHDRDDKRSNQGNASTSQSSTGFPETHASIPRQSSNLPPKPSAKLTTVYADHILAVMTEQECSRHSPYETAFFR
jgi:hypothetical protein